MSSYRILAAVILGLSLTTPVFAKPAPRHQDSDSTCYLRTSDGRTMNLASLCGSGNNNSNSPRAPRSSPDNYSQNNYSDESRSNTYNRRCNQVFSDSTNCGKYDYPISDPSSGGRYNDPFTNPTFDGRYADPISDPTSGGRYTDPFRD